MDSAGIVVVGGYNLDLALWVARFPSPGETRLGRGRLQSAGGKGSNQAIQAARCGAQVSLVAAVGDDAAGEAALALWATEGIDTSRVAVLGDAGTGMAVILVDASGENCIVVDSGANALLAPAHIEAAEPAIAGGALVAAQLETPVAATRRAFELARACGTRTLLNAAPAPAAADLDLLALTDVLVVNALEGAALTGRIEPGAIGEALLEVVGEAVILTLGRHGAMLFEKARPAHAAAAFAVEVVDTTGAGDAFIGALCARLSMGRSLQEAMTWGLAAGGLACTLKGAAASFARAEQIAALAGA
jgi:ribokinase